MKIDSELRDDHQIKLDVVIEDDLLLRAKRRAARKISRQKRIPGFRPGKAPYQVVQKFVGEAIVLEEALEILIAHDWPLIVAEGETTRCIGDVLAVVVADTEHRARTAAAAVAVEYEVLEPVDSPDAALRSDAPAIHPGGNLLEVSAFSRGDVDTALAEAAHVVEETFTTQRIEHAFLEPEAALAVPANDGLKIYSQGQGVHDDQLQIAFASST